MRQFGSYLPLVLKGELRGANPSTRGLGWANLWCTGCYANSSAGQLSWYGRTAAPREILLYTSSRTRFLNRTSIGERCKHREVWSDLVLNETTFTFHNQNERKPIPAIAVSLATSLVAAPYLLIRNYYHKKVAPIPIPKGAYALLCYGVSKT